jgi:Periplasmic binding protein
MRLVTGLAALGAVAVLTSLVVAAAADMRGVTSTEIRIGQTMPYSGPVSAFGALGKGEVGYFRMLNDRGGINGRAINLISLDDGYALSDKNLAHQLGPRYATEISSADASEHRFVLITEKIRQCADLLSEAVVAIAAKRPAPLLGILQLP